ncbi:hypothetical protein IFM89_034518 [Coptis chinensis]|uniref:Aminotransferase-like plant mobile domain-containing protein n=1 Tax=Coptis chinensis TaxID=261450 RepID=A0A835HLR9_9MAGN|nr:hypothetical protein IFM89_034518 [Coptis chinensis]
MSGFGRVLWSSRSRKKAVKQISSRSEDTNPTITSDDPTTYERVVPNEETHVSYSLRNGGTVPKIGLKGTWTPVLKWIKLIDTVEFRQFINDIGFDIFARIDDEQADHALTEAIVERWWDSTHTFHLPCGELGITPLDFTMLTGLRIGVGKPLAYDKRFESFELAEEYLPLLNENDIQYGSIKLVHLEQYTCYAYSDEKVDRDMCLRAFMIYAIGHILCPKSNSTVRLRYLASLTSIDDICGYDWGGAAYAYLIRSLDKVCRYGTEPGTKTMSAIWQVLEYWYYSYCQNGMHVHKVPEPNQFPAINNWGPSFRLRASGEGRHILDLARQQLEFRSRASIIWQPWKGYIEHHYVQRAKELTDLRCIVFGAHVHTWYLGERCLRQVTGETLIPCAPPSPADLSLASPATLQWWSENVGVPAASLVRPVSEDQYKAYWGHVSVGMLLPALRRAVNVDYIGPSGLQDDVHISQPVDATLSYTPYPQREREVDAPDTASNWTIPITLQNGQIIHHHIEPVGRESVPQLPISNHMSRVKMKAMLEDVLHANASKDRVISHISNGMYSTSGDVIRAFNDTVGHSSPEDQHTHSQVFETHMTPPGGVYYPQFEPPQTSRRHSSFHGDSGFDGVRSTFQGDSSSNGGWF